MDIFSYFLTQGQLIAGLTKAWLGGLGEIGTPYTHPTTKQCSYTYTHPSTKQCNAAAGSHTHAASDITSGTFASTATYAKTGTDYTTYRIRNIAANTTAMTAGSSSLANGNIYLQYE